MRSLVAVGAAVLLASVAMGGVDTSLAWSLILVGWAAVLVGGSGPAASKIRSRWGARETVTLGILVAFAVFLRIWRLDEIPPGLFGDEAYHGLDAYRIVHRGYRPLFFPANSGREPIYLYLTASALAFLGNTVWAVRLPAALAGTSLVVGSYVLGRRIGGRSLAALTGLFVSFSCWPLHYSRLGYRAILGPPLATAIVLVLLEKPKTPSRLAAAGALAGALVYTYPAFRLFAVVILVWLAAESVGARERARLTGRAFVAAVLAFVAVLLPLVAVAWKDPALIVARPSVASVFSEAPAIAPALARNAVKYVGMLTIEGDHNPIQNLPGAPMLVPITGWLFLVGLPLILFRERSLRRLVVPWLALMLVPGILSVERQAPHALRCLGLLPVPHLVAAYTLHVFGESFRRAGWARVAVVAMVLTAALTDVSRYFAKWPAAVAAVDPRRRSLYSFNQEEAELARWLSRRSESCTVYLTPQLYLQPTVAYLAPPQRYSYRILRHPRELTHGCAVLCMLERPLWWLRDDVRFRFFDWWTDVGAVTEGEIWEALVRGYPSPCRLETASDVGMLEQLIAAFPGAIPRKLGPFLLFEQQSGEPPPAGGSVHVACTTVLSDTELATGWRRVPVGRFRAKALGCGCRLSAVQIREWCLEPAAVLNVAGGEGVVDVGWPSEVRFVTENGLCDDASVEMRFLGPPTRRWWPLWLNDVRKVKARAADWFDAMRL